MSTEIRKSFSGEWKAFLVIIAESNFRKSNSFQFKKLVLIV